MKKITVSASKQYDVIIGHSLISQIGAYAKSIHNAGKVVIVSDSNVWPLYGDFVSRSLVDAGFQSSSYVFPAGEESKNTDTYFSLLNFLAENHVTRSDLIIALGGGVVGDLTGFTAATFLRGIRYIQVPTTLLAMVDSSVGGKTAVDLPAGKNLVGAFYQPALVVCDIDVLATLPHQIFRDGCAEVIKYGILYDADLFIHLLNTGVSFDKESVIARCVELKRNVVMDDEFDNGARQKLNLGHTIGHGVEANSNFRISHGQAVAIGMAIIARAAAQAKICSADCCHHIIDVLNKFELPVHTDFTAQELYTAALSDKKRSGNTVNLIIPEQIGSCIIKPFPVSDIISFIEAGFI